MNRPTPASPAPGRFPGLGRRAFPLLCVGFAIGLPAAGAGCAAMVFHGEPNAEEIETFTEPFRDGETFDLKNVNGWISLEGWDRQEAEITARKVGPSEAALQNLEVEVDRTGDGLRVRTRYPRRKRRWGRPQGSVRYSVRLPRRANLRIETVNGAIDSRGFNGELTAQTVNGSLTLQGQSGSVNAKTVNGHIECELDRFAADERHNFHTVNGRVRLTLGPEAQGRVDARAVNGRVELELPEAENLTTPTRRRKRVQVGEGGGECRVRTVNGSIRVARAND